MDGSDRMNNNSSFTIEEVSQLLRVSKLTVYDLIKKEELTAFRVGRQMGVDQQDLGRYKSKNKTSIMHEDNYFSGANTEPNNLNLKKEPFKVFTFIYYRNECLKDHT